MIRGNPKVSVCIPNYNNEKYIGDAIKSVLNQTFSDLELIIIDNDSTDNSLEVANEFKDSRIKIIRNSTNIGMTKNWNKCVSKSSGEYIIILHSDDFFAPDIVEKEVKILEENSNVGMVHTGAVILNELSKTHQNCLNYEESYIKNGIEQFKMNIQGNRIYCPTVMVRRECYDTLGVFDDNFQYCPDWEMWLRIALKFDVAYISQPLLHYRVHGDNTTFSFNKTYNINLGAIESYMVIKKIFRKSELKKYTHLEKKAIEQIVNGLLVSAWENLKRNQINLAIKDVALGFVFSKSLFSFSKSLLDFMSVSFKRHITKMKTGEIKQ